ncbi:GGDEF domain-containing protein [Angustibacter aerolatus]
MSTPDRLRRVRPARSPGEAPDPFTAMASGDRAVALAPVAIASFDLALRCTSANPRFHDLAAGTLRGSLLGRRLRQLLPGVSRAELTLLHAVAEGRLEGAEVRLTHAAGETWRALAFPLHVSPDGPSGVGLVAQDVTDDVAERAELLRRLQLDGLTGLLNQTAFAHLLRGTARPGGRRRDETEPAGAVLVLDLDHFKAVNDEHGHVVGDQVLVEVAHRLRAALRDGDTAARTGGDEFAVLSTGAGPLAAAALARALEAAVGGPFETPDGATVEVSVAVGHAQLRPPAVRALDALAAADRDMYASKRRLRPRRLEPLR